MSGDATGKPTTAAGKPIQGGAASTPPAPAVSSPPPSVPPKKAAGAASPTSTAGATKVSGSGGASGTVPTPGATKTAPSTRPGGTPAAPAGGPSPVGSVTAVTPAKAAAGPSTSTAPPARPSAAQAAATATNTAAPTKKVTPGPRRVRLAVARIDPWSAMKLSFLLSIAVGIMMIVAAIVFWMVLDGMYVFTEVDRLVQEVLGDSADVNILQYVEFKRVVSLATIIAIVDIVLLTALATIGAFLYNVVASLVGGVHLTLIDE